MQAGADGKSAWRSAKPVATLIVDGKTIGRHYAGPNWEHSDGSAWSARPPAMRQARPRATFPGLKLQ